MRKKCLTALIVTGWVRLLAPHAKVLGFNLATLIAGINNNNIIIIMGSFLVQFLFLGFVVHMILKKWQLTYVLCSCVLFWTENSKTMTEVCEEEEVTGILDSLPSWGILKLKRGIIYIEKKSVVFLVLFSTHLFYIDVSNCFHTFIWSTHDWFSSVLFYFWIRWNKN